MTALVHGDPVGKVGAKALGTSRNWANGLLQLRIPQLGDEQTVGKDPHMMTFGAKRHYFEELRTPRDDGEPTCYENAKAAKVTEYLLSPRAVPQESSSTATDNYVIPLEKTTVNAEAEPDEVSPRSQPFAEPSPRESEARETLCCSGGRLTAEESIEQNMEVLRRLVETQVQLAQVQSQLATMMQVAWPPVRSRTSICETVVPPPCDSILEERRIRRRWGKQMACSNTTTATAGGGQKVARTSTIPTRCNHKSEKRFLSQLDIFSSAGFQSRTLLCSEPEACSSVRIIAAGATFVVSSLFIACIFSL